MENSITVLSKILAEFFRDRHYSEGVKNLRKSIREEKRYSVYLEGVIRMVLDKEMNPGVPLSLIHDSANLPLDHNSDSEAYKWLNLMLINSLGCEDAPIFEY